MNRIREQRGQAVVLVCVFMVVMLGMAAFVLDIGSWYRTQRDLQAVADAAALAGAQALPNSTSDASALAVEYSQKNGGGSPTVTFARDFQSDDTIKVKVSRDAPTFFSKIFGIDSVNVGARASARTTGMGSARYVAPIAVDKKHPLLNCAPEPCFREETTLDLEKVGPGAFRLMNLDGSRGGTGPPILADWMRNGYDDYMPLGWYYSDPGAKFNSSHFKGAMADVIGKEVLFPIYDETKGQGANFEYRVIGWVGFVVESFDGRGNKGTVTGYFTRVIWEGLQATTSGGNPSFGARAIELVE